METTLEIDISEIAYTELKKLLLTEKDEYSCIRFDYKKSCCKLPPIDIHLDTFENKEDYFTGKFKNIPYIYSKEILTNIKKIELIYKDSTFMIKTTPRISNIDNSHNCSSCDSCTGTCDSDN